MVQGSRIWLLVCTMLLAGGELAGQVTWRRAYGAYADDLCMVVRTASDDRIVAVGRTGSFGAGSSDIMLMATDGGGVRLWSRTIGGPGVESPNAMRICANGDLIIAGLVSGEGGYDGLLVRTGPEGEVLWTRTYGGADWDFLHDVKELNDGGFLLAGETYSFGEPGGNAWLLRTDPQGEVLWERTYGGSGGHEARSVVVAPDGNYVFAGSLLTPGRDRDILVVKVDVAGNEVWTRTHGGDSLDVARDIILAPNGGFSIVGTTRSFSEWNEGYHLKLFEDGTFHWEFHWGQVNDQEFYEHMVVPGDEYQMVGYTKTSGAGGKDMILQRATINGGFIYGYTFGGVEDDEARSVDLIGDGFLLGGSTLSYGAGGWDMFLVRTGPNGLTASQNVISSFDPLSVEEARPAADLRLFPNPSSGMFEVDVPGILSEVQLYDALGRRAEVLRATPGGSAFRSALPPGLYTVEVVLENAPPRRGRLLIQRP